jgi:hypothetical protein
MNSKMCAEGTSGRGHLAAEVYNPFTLDALVSL